jgi:NADPH:quinone reductase-like Zn-dependent oxidoreductase
VIGASGGVGTVAVQIAKAFDASVTGVCSTSKVDLVRSTGADEVIDYTRDDFAVSSAPYEVILDIGGNSSLSCLRSVLTPTGTLVIVGARPPVASWAAMTARSAPLCCPGSSTTPWAPSSPPWTPPTSSSSPATSRPAWSHPSWTAATPLAEAAVAIRHVGQRYARGKVVVAIRTDADRGHAEVTQ